MKKSIKNIAHRLAPSEMKKIKGGDWGDGSFYCRAGRCNYRVAGGGIVYGSCETNSNNNCVCNAGSSSVIQLQCTAFYSVSEVPVEEPDVA